MLRLLPVIVIASLLAGCSGRDTGGATAGAGQPIDVAEVRRIVEDLPESTRSLVGRDQAALQGVVRAELLRRELAADARTAGLDSDPQVAKQLERLHDEALARIWVAKQAKVSDAYPSEEDIKLAYQSNLVVLTPPPQYRVAQIFISMPNGIEPGQLAVAMRKAADVGSKIPQGDFAALARQYSEHADSAPRGGDVGMLPANQMLPEIVAAVRGLEVGAVTGPIKTSQGLHYVKLLEKAVAPTPSLQQASAQLRNALRAKRAQELEQAYLAELAAKFNVAVEKITLADLGNGNATAVR